MPPRAAIKGIATRGSQRDHWDRWLRLNLPDQRNQGSRLGCREASLESRNGLVEILIVDHIRKGGDGELVGTLAVGLPQGRPVYAVPFISSSSPGGRFLEASRTIVETLLIK